MKLEEAIKILNWSQQQMRLGNLPDYSQNVYQAEVAVLQELEHLQKENEGYISGELISRNQAKHFEEINKKYYIHKDKIKDCFDDIEDYFERVSVPYEDIEFIKEKRNDLLKEE